jgi:ATP-dependent Zn protease
MKDLVDRHSHDRFERARQLLLRNRDLLHAGPRRLLEKETLAGAELAQVRVEEPLAA